MINQNKSNMRRNYQTPNTKVVLLQHQCHLLQSTTVTKLNNTQGFKLGGKGTYNARSREFEVWDDED